MDYEKKYKEALERAKYYYDEGKTLEYANDIVSDIFPELKESEDERMRKNIIATIHLYYGEPLEDEAKEMIAWLKKQGEQEQDINIQINPSEYINDMGGNGCYLKNTAQKPADKVEPKFHKGEWLCENEPNNYARFIQILEIVNVQGKDRYRISRDIHKDEDVVEFGFVEKYYHNFDIKDAKTGDVLHCWIDGYEFILIFNCIKDGYVNAFCHLYNNLDSFSEEPTTMFCRTIQGHFTPAAQEQRDLLFSKMKEAGYEWDAEKKELKKIEPKTAWSEEDENRVNRLIAYFEDKESFTAEDDIVYANWLKSIRPQSTWKPSDEQLEALEHAINCYSGISPTSTKEVYTLEIMKEKLKKLREK